MDNGSRNWRAPAIVRIEMAQTLQGSVNASGDMTTGKNKGGGGGKGK